MAHETLEPLFRLARSGKTNELLRQLHSVANDSNLPLPAREKILFQFAVGLEDLAIDAVDPAVLAFLLGYDSRTLIPHEDHRQYGVPLYNVRAAATGVAQSWERQAAAAEAMTLLNRGTEVWLKTYFSINETQRTGFEDTLTSLSQAQLRRLADDAVSLLPYSPEITPIIAECAALLADAGLFGELILHGDGPEIAATLRKAAVLGTSERFTLLHRAILNAPATNASLAIAQLAPELLHRRDAENLLFALLGNAELGAAAALILSRSGNPAILARLAEIGKQTEGLRSNRARLAASLAEQNRAHSKQ